MAARDDAYALDREEERPNALAFVHDRAALARRFLLAELLAPPLSLRAARARREPMTKPPDDDARTRRGGR